MTEDVILELAKLERAAIDAVRSRMAAQQRGELFNEPITERKAK